MRCVFTCLPLRKCSQKDKSCEIVRTTTSSLIKPRKFEIERYEMGKLRLGEPTSLTKWDSPRSLPIQMPRIDTKHNVLKVLKDDFLINPLDRPELIIPRQVEFLIIGGGVLGSALSYFLKKDHSFSLNTLVVDTDFTGKHSHSCSSGIISLLATTPEHLEMLVYSIGFFREQARFLQSNKNKKSVIPFNHCGHLTFSTNSEGIMNIQNLQKQFGLDMKLYDRESLETKFPWIKFPPIYDVVAYSRNHSGVIDPVALTRAYRQKAMKLGAIYATGMVKNVEFDDSVLDQEIIPKFVQIVTPEGRIFYVKAHTFVNASGASLAGVSTMFCPTNEDYVHMSSRQVLHFNLHCPRGPILDMPVIETDNFSLHRLDLANNYRLSCVGETETEGSLPTEIWKEVSSILPAFEECRVTDTWTTNKDTCDRPIAGKHPKCARLFCLGGLGSQATQYSPGLGLLSSQIILDDQPTFSTEPYSLTP